MYCAAFVASVYQQSCFSRRRNERLSSETWQTPDGVLGSREHQRVPVAVIPGSSAEILVATAVAAAIVAEAEIDL